MASKVFGLALALSIGVGTVPSLAADPLSFDFTGGNSSTTGSVNSRTFQTTPMSSLSLTATAYSASSKAANATLSRSYLGYYDLGLGVTNSTDSSHTVDNNGRTDLVVFQFSKAVQASSVSLSAFGDTDVRVWAGTLPTGYDFSGKTIASLGIILTDYGIYSGGGSNRTVTFANFAFGNYLIIAADPSGSDDSFKIASLKAVPGPVAGTGLPVLALLAFAGWAFRKRALRV